MAEHRADAGLTLPELLVGVVLLGLVAAVISNSIIIVMRQSVVVEKRVDSATELQLVQTYLTRDVASASTIELAPDVRPPGTTWSGTNVMQLTWPTPGGAGETQVSYRYAALGDNWAIRRYERTTDPVAEVQPVTVASGLTAPSQQGSWTEGALPAHAVAVEQQGSGSDVGVIVTVHLATGLSFKVAAGTLGAGGEVTVVPVPVEEEVGTAPPTRCAGNIVLLLDTSGSIPNARGGAQVEAAATSFINGFADTPIEMSVIGFDYYGYQMYPAGAYGRYFRLTDAAARTAATTRVTALDDVDGRFTVTDPNNDGIHWNQTGAATNWEDPLWYTTRTNAGEYHATQPTLVVLVTDGEPNRNRTGTGSNSKTDAADVSRAVDAAAVARAKGARVIGVGVGTSFKSGSTGYKNLEKVVGSVAWDGGAPGNAAVANIFSGNFTQLGSIMRSIMASECGGTVSVKHATEGSTAINGPWTYTTETGTKVLNPTKSANITFDYSLGSATTKQVEILETPQQGQTLVRVTCTSAGVALGPDRVTQVPGGVKVVVGVNEAISCTFVGRAT
jgi:prepilin-type N-terminal cleavage/methylation domain-containing protein